MNFLERYIANPLCTGKPHGRNVMGKYLKTIHANKNTGEVVNVSHHVNVLKEQLAKDQCLDGIYFIITNDLNLTSEEIVKTYHGL
jgi:hypothetical protein